VDDLLSTFRIAYVEQPEFEQLLQWHFGASSAPSNREIHYGRHQQPAALILRYDKEGLVAQIETGPGLAADDIETIAGKLHAALVDKTDRRIGQTVLFAYRPLKGWFRFRDVFQLIPMPAEAPRPFHGIGGHPLLMQFRFSASSENAISQLRHSRANREIELLCAALTLDIQGAMPTTTHYHWVAAFGRDLSSNPQPSSEYCMDAYLWHPNRTPPEDYDSVHDFEPVRRMPYDEYYSQMGISMGPDMPLPDAFETLIERYFSRSAVERDRYIRACHWFQFSQRAAGYSNSASYSALVSAAEALMGPEPPSLNRCPTCKRTTGGGSKKRFLAFLEEYAPSPAVSAKDRRQFYELRSAVAHGGRLLHSDRFAWGALTPSSLADWNSQRSMGNLMRVVLINWLGAD
jgi:hypothetical protein